MPSIVPTEQQEAITLVQYCKAKNILLVSVPNGFSSNAREGARQKKMGLSAGFPDYFLPVARKDKHGMFIELKRRKNSNVSELQKRWLQLLNEQGYHAMVCFGADEAIREIEDYLG